MTVSAQGETVSLDHRSFLPKDYTFEAFVDFAGLRAAGLGAALSKSLWLMELDSRIQQLGASWSSLRDVRLAKVLRDDGGNRGALVLRGAVAWRVPEKVKPQRGQAFATPQPGVVVVGSEALLTGVKRGVEKGGVPHTDLIGLNVGKKPLAFFAAHAGWILDALPAEIRSSVGDLRGVCVRLHREGRGFVLSAVARFGEAGVPREFCRALASTLADRRSLLTGPWRDEFDRIAIEEDGADLKASLILRNAKSVSIAVGILNTISILGRHHVVMNDYDSAKRWAGRTDRLLLVNLSSLVCVNCRVQTEGIMLRPKPRRLLTDGFVEARLFIDMPESYPGFEFATRIRRIRRELVGESMATPQWVVVNPKTGKVVGRHAGVQSTEKMVKFLRDLRK